MERATTALKWPKILKSQAHAATVAKHRKWLSQSLRMSIQEPQARRLTTLWLARTRAELIVGVTARLAVIGEMRLLMPIRTTVTRFWQIQLTLRVLCRRPMPSQGSRPKALQSFNMSLTRSTVKPLVSQLSNLNLNTSLKNALSPFHSLLAPDRLAAHSVVNRLNEDS